MRLRLVAVVVGALALPLAASGAAASPFKATFKATFKAPTHTPKINAKWRYEVRVTSLAGKPIKARITSEIVDPYGGVHPVEFGCCKKNVVNYAFVGVFRDYVKFPPESAGFKLTFRVTVKALGGQRALTYWVKPG